MSASREHARELRRGASVLPDWVKDAARGVLAPVVRLAIALHLTPNTITVIGLLITVVAADPRRELAGSWSARPC